MSAYGNTVLFGVNATLRNSITIAPETLIGLEQIIMKDTEEKGVYFLCEPNCSARKVMRLNF